MSGIEEYPVIWLQAGSCTGCSVSVLNSASPTIKNLLIDEILPGKHVNIKYHATIMAGQGKEALDEMEKTRKGAKGKYLLVVEGTVPTAEGGVYGAIGEDGGKPKPFTAHVSSLAADSLAVIAIGTCASFGGIASGSPNPSGSVGVGKFLEDEGISIPLINVPGCPPHPDWFYNTVVDILLRGLPAAGDLDDYKRPKAFYGSLIHENCPRRPYFDEGKFARNFGEPGCLNELGCKGPVTYADCPLRRWNNGANWCIGAGSPCIGCVEPGFPDNLSPMYEKLTDETMPKIG